MLPRLAFDASSQQDPWISTCEFLPLEEEEQRQAEDETNTTPTYDRSIDARAMQDMSS